MQKIKIVKRELAIESGAGLWIDHITTWSFTAADGSDTNDLERSDRHEKHHRLLTGSMDEALFGAIPGFEVPDGEET